MLDIAGLNNANKAIRNESTGGDFLLQKTARLLNQALDEIDQDLKNSFDFIPCRYGGDEFAVAIIKKKNAVFSQEINLEEILKKIERKIASEKAFYNRDGQVTEESITLKNEETKAVSPPSDVIGKSIFVTTLRAGLVLNEEEVRIIKNIFTNEIDKSIFVTALGKTGSILNEEGVRILKDIFVKDGMDYKQIEKAIEDYFRQYYIQEPDYETEALFIMHDLANKHPELRLSLYLANLLDQKDEEQNGQKSGFEKNKKLISLLRFIKRSLGDRLLSGEDVLSFYDFQEHLKREEFEKVISIEMKFVKELNDHFSMVVADDIIRQLFGYLKDKIGDAILSQLYVYRRGGSFFIGVKKGTDLPKDFYQKLEFVASNFSVLNILGRKISSLNIPLGFQVWENPNIEQLKEFMDNLDKNWYLKVPKDVKEKVKNRDFKPPEKPKTTDQLFTQLTLDNLYLLFFGSEKRGKERIERLSTS